MTVLFVVLMDRAIPVMTLRYLWNHLDLNLRDVYAEYGPIRFPRTLFGALTCISSGIDLLFRIDNDAQGLITIFFFLLFWIFGAIDIWRAAKGFRR